MMKRTGLIICICAMALCFGACAMYPTDNANAPGGDAANDLDPGVNHGQNGVGDNDNGLFGRSPTAGAYGNRFGVTAQRMASNPKLSLDEAKAIALAHAGLSDADFVHVKMEKDDGALVYKLAFIAGETRYRYEIDAGSGNIISYSQRTRTPAPESRRTA